MDSLESKWIPLRCMPGLANTVEDITRNIESVLTRPYIGLQTILDTESGAVSVVGSGPSLKENWQQLRDSDTDIIACNAAFQFLLEKGVVPKYMFCFDADPLMLEFITPRQDVTYLIASRCPPKTFEMLEGCNVIVWHTAGDPCISDLLTKHDKMEPMISGGTAAVTRAMILAPTLGYRTIHLWGCDSSYSDTETHIRKSTTDEIRTVIKLNNKVFQMSPWMAQQCEDFKILAPILRDRGVRVKVHGHGILPHLAAAMFFEVDGYSRLRSVFEEIITKSRILWRNL